MRSPISRRWRRRCGRRCVSCGWRACAPQQIPPEAFASPAKHKELRALLTAYETFLATEKRGDMADRLRGSGSAS